MKKLISYVLAVVMVLSLVPTAFAAESGVSKFTDVPADAWYLDELVYAVEHGYISGTSDTTFSPSANLTRAQFVTILGRMLNVDTTRYTSSKFTDVDAGSWYGPYVAWAADMGYVNGTSATTFAPDNNLTFEQMGTIMANYIDKSGVVLTPSSTFSGYADAASISAWAKASMEVMAKYDLLPVNEVGNVRPTSSVIRSEAAVALVRLAKGDGKGGKLISDGTGYSDSIPKDVLERMNTIIAARDAKIQSIHDELWASGRITSSMSEKEKAIEYFRWMCANTLYGCRSIDNPDVDINHNEVPASEYPWEAYSSVGPLLTGRGVCEGMASAYSMLLDTEGITNNLRVGGSGGSVERTHVWNAVVLDGEVYEVDTTCSYITRNPDGSFSEASFRNFVEKYFYPEEWEKQFEGGFGGPLTEEEIQKKLDEFQAEYNASFGQ